LKTKLPEKHVVSCFLECEGRILILRRSQAVGSFKGRWAGISGYVETTADEQVLIEIKEETGLNPHDVKLITKGDLLSAEDEGIRWVVHSYLFQTKEPDKIRINWEHTEKMWIRPEDIRSFHTVPMLIETLARVYQF
jgi:ADP-ribose pyrophosphatase YjhB (NUDIX family)